MLSRSQKRDLGHPFIHVVDRSAFFNTWATRRETGGTLKGVWKVGGTWGTCPLVLWVPPSNWPSLDLSSNLSADACAHVHRFLEDYSVGTE